MDSKARKAGRNLPGTAPAIPNGGGRVLRHLELFVPSSTGRRGHRGGGKEGLGRVIAANRNLIGGIPPIGRSGNRKNSRARGKVIGEMTGRGNHDRRQGIGGRREGLLRRETVGRAGEGAAGGIRSVESEEADLTNFGVDDAGASASIHEDLAMDPRIFWHGNYQNPHKERKRRSGFTVEKRNWLLLL